MENSNTSDWELYNDVSGIMEIRDWGYKEGFLCFHGRLKVPSAQAFRLIYSRAKLYGLLPYLASDREGVILKLTPARMKKRKDKILIQIALFVLTVMSTLIAWAWVDEYTLKEIISRPGVLLKGIPFTVSLLIILGLHELSHYAVSLRYGIKVSLPYFIPFPNILGTMGAVIVGRSPFPDRKSLFDVGIAGPLASFILSLIVLIIGLQGSKIVPPVITSRTFFIGSSLLYDFICWIKFPHIPYGYTYSITPMMFAGWVGFFVTALNLLPIGQLDGGHISYALFGRYHKLITRFVIVLLVIFGVLYFSPIWIVIGLFVLVMGATHGPPLDDITPLNPGRIWLAVSALIILIICFIPVPIQMI